MATVQRYVNTASSGGDGTTNATSGGTAAYAGLQACITALGVGSASNDYVIDCCGTTADTAVSIPNTFIYNSLIIRGNTTDSAGKYTGTATISTAHYRIRQASAASALVLSNGSTGADNASKPTTVISGIQIDLASTGTTLCGIDHTTLRGNLQITGCRILRTAGGGTGVGIGPSTSGGSVGAVAGWYHTAENNLVVAFGTEMRFSYPDFWTRTVTVQDNTFYGNGGNASAIEINDSASGDADYIFKGNASGNTGTAAWRTVTRLGSGGTITYADNASSVASGTTDEIVLGTAANAWTSPGVATSSDFSVKDTFSSLYSVVNPTLVSNDITGYVRDGVNHDVGAFEYQTVSLTTKLKLLAHSSAASATAIAGAVFSAPTGGNITGAKIGEFTGGAFSAVLESGQAVLKVAVTDFGGSALTTSDTPVAIVRNSSNTTGIVTCSVIQE